MGYFFLFATICSEVTGTTMMKLSEGFANPLPSALAFVCYACTLFFMTLSMNRLGMSLVYACWSGAGITLVTIIGTLAFKEPFQPIKILWIAFIITGVIGLNLMKR